MLVLVVFIIFVVWYFVSFYKWRKNMYNYIEKIPGPVRLPIVGTLYIFLLVPREDIFSTMMLYTKIKGPFFRTWRGSQPEINVMKAEHLELLLNNSVHITKAKHYELLHPWLGEGLLTSAGAKWHQHRKLITPTFHFKILDNFMGIFVENTEALLKILDEKSDGRKFNIYTDITRCTLDIICETAMGVSVNAMSESTNEYIESLNDLSQLLLWRVLKPYIPEFLFRILPEGRRFRKNVKVLHEFSQKVIADRKKVLKQNSDKKQIQNEEEILGKKNRLSFLDLLLEASEDGKFLSDTDIREEVDTFMFEGHDTTTVAMFWCLFILGHNPEVQEKAFEEITTVLKNKPTPTSIAQLHELKYLECVIKESLRLYPSVPFIIRAIQQEMKIDGYTIPVGSQAIVHIYSLHRNSDYFPNPSKFDPDRFLPENSVGRHPFAYVPFSAGPRNCVGQKFAMYEEKTILASIIKRYKLTATKLPDDMKILPEMTLRPLDGEVIRLERRI